MPIKPTTHVSETGMFMAENPKYREILQRAVEIEERDAQKEHWLGGSGTRSERIRQA